MSNRLRPEWTPTLGEAYGKRGEKGHTGELLAVSLLQEAFPQFNVVRYSWQVSKQCRGIDIELLEKDGTVFMDMDIKTNMHGNGAFCVEVGKSKKRPGWLFDPKKTSEFILHINIEYHEWIVYPRESMKNFMNELLKTNPERVFRGPGNKQLVRTHIREIQEFIVGRSSA